MHKKNLQKLLKNVLLNKDEVALNQLLMSYYLADISDVLNSFTEQEVVRLLSLVSQKEQVKIFSQLSTAKKIIISEVMDEHVFIALFLQMQSDDRADLFSVLPIGTQKSLISQITQSEREDIWSLTAYKEDEVGSIMNSDYALLGANLTVGQGMALLQQYALDTEIVYQAYIVDHEHQLVGTISLRDLMLADATLLISEVMTNNPITVSAESPKASAVQLISKYDLIALPVINNQQKMVGIVTYDDAMDVAAEMVAIDFNKSSAVGSLAIDIKEASIKLLYQKRVFWLVILVFGNVFSGAGIAYFEDTITAYIALVFFLPLLVDSGGNAGSQSATLMVRALATGQVQLKDWASMLGREFIVASLLGLTMALAVSVLGIWRGGVEIALVVALTMQLIVIVGSVVGMLLPFMLSRFNMDPAAASAPLITSIADGIGVLIYFTIATWLLEFPAAL